MTISHKTLARNGYILKKNKLTKKELCQIKADLEVLPQSNPDYQVDIEPFNVYTEDNDTITVPRYYGIEHFGQPTKIIPMNTNKMDIVFKGSLRDNQIPVIDKCLDIIKKDGGGIISLPCGFGKCLARGTPILMYDGTIKLVENIQVGDKLMGDDSSPRNVLSLARGREEMYDIIPIEGPKYTVNKSHILSLKYNADRELLINGINYKNGDVIDISVNDYLKLPKYYQNMESPIKGYRSEIDFESKYVNINPYILGLWLANDISNLEIFIKKYNLDINTTIFINELKELNVFENKHIPHIYKCNSRQIRLSILAGILDAQLSCNLRFRSEQFIDDIIFISRSLGLAAYKSIIENYYQTTIYGNINVIPTKITQNKSLKLEDNNNITLYGITVVPIGIDNYYGFEIDGNKRFLLGDFTVTHNTTISLYMAQQLGLKTLVVVHKSFLQNQWYDRIKQFTNAKIGMIRQNKIDVKDKDIVVAMLHSISMKDYDLSIFDEFGCVIFDECFVRKERIITSIGSIQIGQLYDMWIAGKELPLIKSFNEKKKQFEFKKMTYAWKKETDSLVKVKIGNQSIICTPNHRFLTINGYKEAKTMTSNDILISVCDNNIPENLVTNTFAKALNNDQIQIILGSFLGNGNIDILENERYIFHVVCGIEQQKYCEWKASMFGINALEYKQSTISFQTNIFDFENKFPENKSTCPQWIIDQMNLKAITIWIMDVGLMDYSSNINISTYSFDEDTQIRLVKRLSDFGILSYYCKDEHGQFYININETKKLLSEMYKYIHPSMIRKFMTNSLNEYTYIWNREFLEYTTCKVNNVNKHEIKEQYKYVYDIEVEDNHNFIIGNKNELQTGPIVHNCHHLAARVFSKAMMKTGGHYTIGLSATPQRADGLTKVINWYIGDIIYKIVRKGDKNVAVRMFNYETKDKLFLEKKQYVKGNTVLSLPKMITNLGKITGRNKFIVDILNNLKNQDERKILVLSNRIAHLELLKDMLDKIIKEDIEKGSLVEGEITTAYYIGKMKDLQLTIAAEADIIFASYAMAEEGLDIDKLNTLVLATPKKNIIQSIGRILRKPIKEGDISPLIIDIVDELSIFSTWGKKRQEYYNKEGYNVESFQSMNDKCVSVKEYLIKNKIISASQTNVNYRKEFICHKFGVESWELEQDLMSDDEKDNEDDYNNPKYIEDPKLDDILNIII